MREVRLRLRLAATDDRFYLYSVGGHGVGIRKQNLPSDSWIERFEGWLEVHGLLDR